MPRTREYFVANGIAQPELKIMVSGDRWCSETGFHISEEGQKFFEERETRLEWYRRNKAPVLEKFYRLESETKVSLDEVRRYFEPFLRSVPSYFRWWYRNRPVTFVLSAGGRTRFLFEVEPLYEYQVPPVGKLRWGFFETWLLRWREIWLYVRIATELAVGKKFDECRYIGL